MNVPPSSSRDATAVVSDQARIAAVRDTRLLDTLPEEVFDAPVRVAARSLGVPVAFISLVDETRDFYKSCVGFSAPLAESRELRGQTFCHFAIASEGPLVIPDTWADPTYRAVPTVQSLGIRAYLGVPMRTPDGHALGSFCAVDFRPRDWSAADVELLVTLAAAAMREVNLRVALRDAAARERASALVAAVSLQMGRSAPLEEMVDACADLLLRHFEAFESRIAYGGDLTCGSVARGDADAADDFEAIDVAMMQMAAELGPLRVAEVPRRVPAEPTAASGAVPEFCAFTGLALIAGGAVVGGLGVRTRRPLSMEARATLQTVANVLATGIQRRQTADVVAREARQKDVFVATLAHELRQPLGALVPALTILRTRPATDDIVRVSDIIARQVEHLRHLVEDLHDSAAVTQGKLTLRLAPSDLRAPIAAAAEQVQAQVQRRQLTLHVSLPDEPLTCVIDAARMQQVFSNLLTNAVKYTDEGGRIDVWVSERSGAKVTVAVRDTGRGIAPAALPHVFELFVQEARDQRGGLGLGLNLVRSLVQLHGGRVTARSEGEGCGSEFFVTLPIDAGPSLTVGSA